jgi:hypothetical protein
MAAGVAGARRVGAIPRVTSGDSTCGIPGGCGGVEVAGVAGWLRDGSVDGKGGKSASSWLLP